MADNLTPQQTQAVNDRGGKLLVSAAAGSGKTKVLVDRLMKYLTDPVAPANMDDFLIITYTKAAASELRGKIAAKLTERVAREPENKHLQKQMQRLFLTKISTVHGFCADILREYAYRLDLPADFRVADENECREMRETVLLQLLERAYDESIDDPSFRAFVDTQGLGRDDRLVPEIIEKVYDSAKCHLDPEKWLDSCLKGFQPDSDPDAAHTLWGSYLIGELKDYLSAQIHVMEQCAESADQCAGLEKAAINLRHTLYQLKELKQRETWDEIVAAGNIDYGRLVFPRKCDDPELVERIKAARNACKKGLEKQLHNFTDSSGQIMTDLQQCAAGAQGLVELVRKFDREYARIKKSRRCLDFSDLEHKTLDLLLGKGRNVSSAAAKEIGSRFREIMVDEYQDSNGVQDAIFSVLTGEKQNCFMVGDVKQSIYQFRLADPGIFLEKYQHYVPADEAQPGQGRKVLLSHNFRSGPEVIEAVNHVFRSCMTPRVGGLAYGEGEALREGISHGLLPDTAVELHALEIREDTYGEEAAFVAERIRTMLDSGTTVRDGDGLRSVTPDDIVILLRSPGSVGGYFQLALENRGVRCASGGGNDLLQTMEIGTLRSLLRTVYNPRQDIPLVSTLASPVFGFTADELAKLRSVKKSGAIYDALFLSELPKVRQFLTTLATLRREARMNPLTKLLETCFVLTRLDSIYGAMGDGDARRENLQTFFAMAAEFEAGGNRGLGEFLEYLDALEEKGVLSAGNNQTGAVKIMSIHKSKGLEFPVVILAGLGREFNRESLRTQILCDRELGLGLSVVDNKNRIRYPGIAKRAIATKMTKESLSEEMRILYVAMTRAKDRLIMTYASRNLQGDLQDIALRRDFDGGELLCRDVVCPGEWVLKAAMERTEAGAFFALAGKPSETLVSDIPWEITVDQAPEVRTESPEAVTRQDMPERTEDILRRALSFHYGHINATQAPSKQTATQLKGRVKDAEAAEQTREPKSSERNWRRPSFVEKGIQGKTYGTALHAVMQHIRYDACGSVSDVQKEVERIASLGFLDSDMVQRVDCRGISAFFQTELGSALRAGVPCIREFKFSILDDGSRYAVGLEGEKVLLQGVVDCAILEEDGIILLDFKTDRVTEETLPQVVERYRPQVEAYAKALERIYEKTVKSRLLYFFHIGRFAEL